MKKFVAIFALGLQACPLLKHLFFEGRAANADPVVAPLTTLLGILGGLNMGFAGFIIFGLVMDFGSGHRSPALLAAMALLGILWCVFYPSEWLLGVAMILYSLLNLIKNRPQSTSGEEA